MADFEGKTFSEGTVEYTIHEHIAVLERYEGREVPWTKEINVVSWNGGEPKIDIRDWSESHERPVVIGRNQLCEISRPRAPRPAPLRPEPRAPAPHLFSAT